MSSSRPLLSIEELSVAFADANGIDNEVVTSFSLQVRPKEIVGIVGESGSGKSVSLLSVTQLIDGAKLKAKRVDFSCESMQLKALHTCSDEELATLRGNHISYVFQEPMTALHPLFTCGKQVEEMILAHQNVTKADVKKEVIHLFEEMRLPDPERAYSSYPHQLSGGQRQRVMIAMALANNPDLVIADEPTTALDSVVQQAVIDRMVEGCKTRGAGLILVSHDLNLIKHTVDYLVVMYQGKIIEQGKAEEVVNHPKSEYTKGLLSCQPTFNKRASYLPTIADLANFDGNAFVAKKTAIRSLQPVLIDQEKPLMSITNLSKSYIKGKQVTVALKRIDLDIFSGETLGLVGESGCGKSTLAKILMKLLDYDSGEILFEGTPLDQNRKRFARKVQMIFQDPYSSLNPNMSVGETIAEPMLVHGLAKNKKEAKVKVSDLLIEVGLTEESFNKYPHAFSGGQRQRISIARALSVEPELIICDESVSALDVSVQAQILNLFNQIKRNRKLTYVFISHDLNVVSYFCDRIAVLEKGVIVELDSSEKISTHPEHDYTKMLMGHQH
ncbi:MAG: peptide/nickel transport system ATP-binding protein [Bacteroidia bacterium]|jgi:peptide/nickel transport system ATP-binding protein